VILYSATALDVADTPEVDTHAVEERNDGDDGEGCSGGEREVVTKVEQSRGDGAEDDGELELLRWLAFVDCRSCESTTYPSKECPLSSE